MEEQIKPGSESDSGSAHDNRHISERGVVNVRSPVPPTADDRSHKDVYLEVIKSVSLGTILAVGVGALGKLIGKSYKAKNVRLPTGKEINELVDDKTTWAVSGVFGYFGLRDAVRHNRQVDGARNAIKGQDVMTSGGSFVDRVTREKLESKDRGAMTP